MRAAPKITDRISLTVSLSSREVQRHAAEQRLALRDMDDALTEALMDSFPASDPVSSLRLA